MENIYYTSDHLELREEDGGTLTVRLTKWGEEAFGGVSFVDWDARLRVLVIEGKKKVREALPPVEGVCCWTPPDLSRPVAGQTLLVYAAGWRLKGPVMLPGDYLDFVEKEGLA